MVTNKELERQITEKWRHLQSEDSRDRGWNVELVFKLRKELFDLEQQLSDRKGD